MGETCAHLLNICRWNETHGALSFSAVLDFDLPPTREKV